MKKKSTSQSARVLIALLVCGAACSIVTGTLPTTAGKLAFFRTETPVSVSHPTTAELTFAQRVSYQRAIEDVYWRHRIWPRSRGEHPDPKPSLDKVMTQAQLEKKVADYLRDSQALEDYWQQPITAEQLQAETERMAKHTRQPEVLRELFAALGNDPFVIAECLARPALSARLLTNFYAHDQRFHGQLKQRAEADLKTHRSVEQMKQLGGNYSEIDLVRSDSVSDEENRGPEPGLKLSSAEWDQNVEKLAAEFDTSRGREAAALQVRRYSAAFESANMSAHSKGTTQQYRSIPVGVLSSLQEDESRYYATAVVKKTRDRLNLATVEWRKEPLEAWKAKAESQLPKVMAAVSPGYTLPTISDEANGCTNDTWTATNDIPTSGPGHTAVWTGSEMIVWGGSNDTIFMGDLNTGGKYNPSTDTWVATSTTNAPTARVGHTAVWTGSEMIVWGGQDESNAVSNIGGRYNPGTDSWTATTTTNAPSGRYFHTAVWTGSEMIVWGGDNFGTLLNTGGRYNPGTDSWTATTTTNAPSARYYHTAVWTGSEMIIWGDTDFSNTGARYNPSTNSWTATTTTNAPSGRRFHIAAWTGSEMIVWGWGGPELLVEHGWEIQSGHG